MRVSLTIVQVTTATTVSEVTQLMIHSSGTQMTSLADVSKLKWMQVSTLLQDFAKTGTEEPVQMIVLIVEDLGLLAIQTDGNLQTQCADVLQNLI